MDVVAETPAVDMPSAAPVETTSEPESSLADHEAQFGKQARREGFPAQDASEESGETAAAGVDKDPATGRFRQRAKSQHASAKDVDQIHEQTRRLRQAETALGLKIEKQPGESDRVFALRRQAEIAEAAVEARRPRSAPAPALVAQPRQEAAPAATPSGSTFDKPRPRAEDFANSQNPLDDYVDAVSDWRFEKKLHDAQQQILATRAQQTQADAIAKSEQLRNDLNSRLEAHAQTSPNFWAKLDKVDKPELALPHVLAQAIVSDLDTAPKIMEYLADHEDELEDAISFSAPFGDDLSPASVALVRRRLNRFLARSNDVRKGASSPAPAPVLVAPRPPTPLGTGPLKTGDEPPGDDDMSIANHEKFYGRKRR